MFENSHMGARILWLGLNVCAFGAARLFLKDPKLPNPLQPKRWTIGIDQPGSKIDTNSVRFTDWGPIEQTLPESSRVHDKGPYGTPPPKAMGPSQAAGKPSQ